MDRNVVNEEAKKRLDEKEHQMKIDNGEVCECCGQPLLPFEYKVCTLCAMSQCRRYLYVDPDTDCVKAS